MRVLIIALLLSSHAQAFPTAKQARRMMKVQKDYSSAMSYAKDLTDVEVAVKQAIEQYEFSIERTRVEEANVSKLELYFKSLGYQVEVTFEDMHGFPYYVIWYIKLSWDE